MTNHDSGETPVSGADEPTGTPVGRRVVLSMLGLGALGVAFGSKIAGAVSEVGRNDPTGLLPAAGGFRYYSVVSQDPQVAPADYRLRVGGRVAAAREFTFGDLAAMPQTELIRDFQCVTGWRVPHVAWTGVLLRDVLAAAGADTAGARAVNLTSFDGEYTESLTMEQALRDDVLAALTMDGAPVTNAHGGPVRLYVAAMYGYKSLKWLGGIDVADQIDPGYWEVRGYEADAWVGESNGRNDAPTA